MNKPWKVILTFAGVFIAGGVCGVALAPRWFGHGRPPAHSQFGGLHLMDRLSEQLELTAAQKEKIAPIVAHAEMETRRLRRESAQSFHAVMERANTEIAAELTPEQRTKLDDMRKRFRERIERFRGEARDRDHDRTPPPSEKP